MNNPVNFELAKLLKEKGFNKSTNLMYSSNGISTNKVYDFDDWCFAPTIAEVVMWLYEEHKIWVTVSFANKNMWFFNLGRVGFSGKEKSIFLSNYDYPSPTEAYEAGIKYVLEKMITDNSK